MAELIVAIALMILIAGLLIGWAMREDRRRQAAGDNGKEGVV